MNAPDLTRLSKTLSFILRHRPDEYGLRLGPGGFVPVASLLAAMVRRGHRIDRPTLDRVVAADAKGRYAFSPDRPSIRANQGHSTDVAIDFEIREPPAILWHGTVADALPSIQREGLRPQARHHVHLSADRATATSVGARRGRPVLLRIDATAMRAAGHVFRISANGVWLADTVPPQFLTVSG